MDIVAYKIGKSRGDNSGTETVTIDIKDRIKFEPSYSNTSVYSAILRKNGNVGELEIILKNEGGFPSGDNTPVAFYFENNDEILPKRLLEFSGFCHSDSRYPAYGNGVHCWWFFNCFNTTLTSIPVYIRPMYSSQEVAKLNATFLY